MNKSIVTLLIVGAAVMAAGNTSTAQMGIPKAPGVKSSPPMSSRSESELIAYLSSTNDFTVFEAMWYLKKKHLHSPKAVEAVKKLLTDSRLGVKERAAGWLGISHASVNEDEVRAICALLKEPKANEILEGLRSLRGVRGPAVAGAVPEIVPFLKHSNTHVVREACQTLAIIGDKSLIPQIEPLLKHSNSDVRLDAQDAIYQLQSKS